MVGRRSILLCMLAALGSQAQEVNVYGTTLARLWKQEASGFDPRTFAPATQFLGVDAVGLGSDTLSLHLFGWGRTEFADPTRPEGKSGGELTYGFLRWRAPRHQVELLAGRITIHQGISLEQIDGGALSADLAGGFTLSAFGGRPVLQRTSDLATREAYDFQRDVVAGGRIGKRFQARGEIGLSFLMDGTSLPKDMTPLPKEDFTRRQVAADLRYATDSLFEFNGRTVWDAADRLPGREKDSSIAEHDYSLGLRFSNLIHVAGTYTQRNFRAYFAGTNLPSLFRPTEQGRFKAQGLSATLGNPATWQAVVSVRRTNRESYGQATRYGADLRWHATGSPYQAGASVHRVVADDVPLNGVRIPSYGLSHVELRAWAMAERGKAFASLDGILLRYDDRNNPSLDGRRYLYEAVGSLGYKASDAFKGSADLGYLSNPAFKKELRALLRLEFRFGFPSKGGAR